MRHKYLLRNPIDSDLEFYRQCFFDNSWRKAYGIGEFGNREEDIQAVALADYPNIERFLVCRYSKILGFFHLETYPEDNRCTLSGGIVTDMINSGNGLRGLCLVLDYIFSKRNFNKVCCEVAESNRVSTRILLGVGFQQEGILLEHRFDKASQAFSTLQLFGMVRRNYPSPIIRKVISKFDYESG